MENKTAEEIFTRHLRESFNNGRGNHLYFIGAMEEYHSLQSSKDREAYDQLKVDYDNLQSLSDQQEERIKELKDERDSLSQMVLEMVGESEEQIMKEFLEFKNKKKALNL